MSGGRILPLSAIFLGVDRERMQNNELPLRLEIQPKGQGSCSFVILRRDGTVFHIAPLAYASVALALAEGTEAVKQFTASIRTR